MALATTVTDALDESRFLLNDTGATLYTDTVMLKPFRKAYQELENIMVEHGLQIAAEVAADQTITALATVLTTIPSDMLFPITLYERTVGADDNSWIEIRERAWEPNIEPTDILRYWAWREQAVRFVGATVDREVRLRYKKTFPAIASEAATIVVNNSKTFLAARSAQLAARFIGGDRQRYEDLAPDVNAALATLINTHIKRNQSMPIRRRPYNWRRRYRRGGPIVGS